MKKRISISLRRDLIRKADEMVAVRAARSRSHAIEQLMERSLEQRKCCVIIAGGDPKNLWVEELKAYRPLVHISAGRTLIEDTVAKVVRAGYTNIFIVGSSPLITEIFKALKNGEEFDCKIVYIEEKEYNNTANTLALAKDRVGGSFLFVPCDHWFDFNLRKLEEVHGKGGYLATLAIYAGARYEWHKTAMVELDGNQISRYWDTPHARETHMVSAFIGLFEPSIFDMIPTESCSLQRDIFPELAKVGKLGGVVLAGNFVNLHTRRDLEKIRELLKLKKSQT